MNEVTLTLTLEQIELLINTIEYSNVEDMYEDNAPEEVLDNTFESLSEIQKYLTRKLG